MSLNFDFVSESILPDSGVLKINSSGALAVPIGGNAARPVASADGMLRYNNGGNTFEFRQAGNWVALGTVTSVGVSVTGDGISVSGSPVTTNGTISLTVNGELSGLALQSGTGLLTRTGAGTFAHRTLSGTTDRVSVTNGDGVSGNPTIDLAVSGVTSGTYTKVTVDDYGRVTVGASITDAEIVAALGYTPVNKAGDTMTGFLTLSGPPTSDLHASTKKYVDDGLALKLSLSGGTMAGDIDMGGSTITGLASPSAASDAVTKNYVDSLLQGLSWKNPVRAASAAAGNLATDFQNGSVIDGITLVTGDRILIKNQADASENGVYEVSETGTPVRAPDMNVWSEVYDAAVFVAEGTLNGDRGFVCTSDPNGTLGTTTVDFVQFSSAGSYAAGTALSMDGNVFNVNVSDSSIGVLANELVVRSTATSGQVLRSTGSDGAEATWGALDLANSNAVTGTLAIVNGGTGGTTAADARTNLGVSSANFDTAALTSVATSGLLVRSGPTTASSVVIAGTTNQISVTNGDGSSGNPTVAIASNPILPGTASVTLPSGADGDRPGVPTAAMVRFNTTGNILEYHNGSTWRIVNSFDLVGENSNSTASANATGTNAVAIGPNSTASALGSVALGSNVSAAASHALAAGFESNATLFGQFSHAAGSFSSGGDAQSSTLVARALTTDDTQTELFLDGSAQRIVVKDNSTWFYSVMVVGRRTDVPGERMAVKIDGAIDKGATSGSVLNLLSSVSTYVKDSAWDVTVDADTTNGSLRIRATGELSKTIRWVAFVKTVEVAG